MENLVTFHNANYLDIVIGDLEFPKSVIHFDNKIKLLTINCHDAITTVN